MRNAFIKTLVEIAEKDDKINLVVGDVGYSVVEPFCDKYPERFVNVGVAEQNMMGFSAGMALTGRKIFTYTFANFTVLRCLEQIRNDICYHNANVNIIGVGGGLVYGSQGITHHGTEDVAVMSALPNMTVIVPADPYETSMAVKACASRDGPSYIRLRKSGEERIHGEGTGFTVGEAIHLVDGSDVTLIASGPILGRTLEAAKQLTKEGISARVLSMHTIKPLDVDAVKDSVRDTGAIVTLEEHSIRGLGFEVAAVVANHPGSTKFLALGLPDGFNPLIGCEGYLLKKAGLDVNGIRESVRGLLSSR